MANITQSAREKEFFYKIKQVAAGLRFFQVYSFQNLHICNIFCFRFVIRPDIS